MELDPNSGMEIKKTYIYANSQILSQHNGSCSAPRYFYLHDRLGSVRLVINSAGDVNTYKPFGEMFTTEFSETVSNPFKFSGQFFDDEIGQYYLRARQYDPYISRFTSRDPVDGKFEEPMSLHKYLYCQNDPINRTDPQGLWLESVHRQFGNWGWGYDRRKGWAPFDYARLDKDKSPFDSKYTELHYRSRGEIFGELLGAATTGIKLEFEYLMHQWQDSYVHYDRGFRAPAGHAPFWWVDDPKDAENKKRKSFDRCMTATLVWEDIWFKNNATFVLDEDGLSKDIINISTPWLSYSQDALSWLIDF